MGSTEQLHDELLKFLPNVYFQPPSNLTMKYPCIVYSKNGKSRRFGNDRIYNSIQGYQLTVIEIDPYGTTADDLEESLQYCTINQNFVIDGLHHTTLNLYY